MYTSCFRASSHTEYQGHQPQNLRTPHHQSCRAKTRKQTPFLLDQLWSISCPQLLALPPRGPNICGLLHPTPTLAPQNATRQLLEHSFPGRDQSSSYLLLNVRGKPRCLAEKVSFIWEGRIWPGQSYGSG